MKERVTKTASALLLTSLAAAACTSPRTTPYNPDNLPTPSPMCTYLPIFEQSYAVMANGPEAGMPISPDDQKALIGNAALQLVKSYPTRKEWTESPAVVGTVTAYLTEQEVKDQLWIFARPDYQQITDTVRNQIIAQAQDRLGQNLIAPKRIVIDISSKPVPHPQQTGPNLRHIGIRLTSPECTPVN